ncbi:helix-turn-helix domain-containing protein [Candidatus Protofrankia californiensis]|uniref:Helix-turn-helix domain-containing protein n=1 Tax=Candidatus Protofrankia californiensis TaxID=1839754 RepID=A0A1C3P316_9ACTN|nr:helix-turn-helix domain-containing protein [Candidatus Protofrankia californiensis]
MTIPAAETGNYVPVGTLIRGWRERRRISQLELALRADSSARHISFIETGRTRPSQAMVLRLAEHLDVPIRDRNALLVAAGYAPIYTETPLHDPAMYVIRAGLERLLTAYEPNPALIMDGGYDVVIHNRGVRALLENVSEHLLKPPMNAIRLTLHPQGLAPRIRNLAEWRAHLLERIERQIALRSSSKLRELYEEVSAYPAPSPDTADGERPSTEDHPVALSLRIEVGGKILSFISTVTTFNTPMDVTVSELAVETFLPADPETADALQTTTGRAPAGFFAGRS